MMKKSVHENETSKTNSTSRSGEQQATEHADEAMAESRDVVEATHATSR